MPQVSFLESSVPFAHAPLGVARVMVPPLADQMSVVLTAPETGAVKGLATSGDDGGHSRGSESSEC